MHKKNCLIVDSPLTIMIGANFDTSFDKVILEVVNPDAVKIKDLVDLASKYGFKSCEVHILSNPYHRPNSLKGFWQIIKLSFKHRYLKKLLKKYKTYGPNNSLVMSFVPRKSRVYFDHGLGELIERAKHKKYLVRRFLGLFFPTFTRGVLYKVDYLSLLDEKKPLPQSLGKASLNYPAAVNSSFLIKKGDVNLSAMYLFGHDSFLPHWRQPTSTELDANIHLLNSIFSNHDKVLIKFHPSILGDTHFSYLQDSVDCQLILPNMLIKDSHVNSIMAETFIQYYCINRLDSRFSATNYLIPDIAINRCHLHPFSDYLDYDKFNKDARLVNALSNSNVEIVW